LVILIAIRTVVRTWVEIRKSGGTSALIRLGFEQEAQQLLETGRSDELLALAKSRCAEAPGNALAHWYYAMAAYRLGDLAHAVQVMRKVGELQPDWRQSHVDPFVDAVSPSVPPAPPSNPVLQ
jgi:hypothetical protein